MSGMGQRLQALESIEAIKQSKVQYCLHCDNTALSRFDLPLMPRLPCVATKLYAPDAPIEEIAARAFEISGSTSPFDVTGHPAISVPCGLSEGLPVGLILVARHWGEATLYRAAKALERSVDWQTC